MERLENQEVKARGKVDGATLIPGAEQGRVCRRVSPKEPLVMKQLLPPIFMFHFFFFFFFFLTFFFSPGNSLLVKIFLFFLNFIFFSSN